MSASITKKELDYQNIWQAFPLDDIPVDTRVRVRITGRNDMDTNQKMGIYWFVADPDGYIAQEYTDWEMFWTGPGLEQVFVGSGFDLSKVGKYTIWVELLENPDDPQVVDRYIGDLCIVTTPITYAGEIVDKWVNKAPEGFGLPIPAAVKADGNAFEVGVTYRNDSTGTIVGGCEVIVTRPDGQVFAPPIDWTGMSPGETLSTEYQFPAVDQEGNWTIVIRFLAQTVELDRFSGVCLVATEVLPAAEFQNLVVTGYDGVPVGEPLMVTPGQTVTVHMSVDYRGPAIDGAIYTGIGWRVGIVIEQFVHTFTSRTPVHFEDSYEFTPHEFDCDVDILTLPPAEELLYGTLLDMYAKIIEVPGADIYTPFYLGVIAWGKPIEEYELIQHTLSHFAYIYEGDKEVTTITLRTDPFKPADWVPEKFIAELEREARGSGVRILETKVYVDTSPLFWTDYMIEVTGTPPPGGVGVGVVIPLFVKIILLALSVAFGIWVITWAVKQFLGVFKTKPGLDDMKPTWGKEALVLDIRDSEEFFERPLTPVETLEGMSEAELRHLLNEIAEDEVPTGVGWGAVAIVGGVAVLGVGAAIALSAGRPRE